MSLRVEGSMTKSNDLQVATTPSIAHFVILLFSCTVVFGAKSVLQSFSTTGYLSAWLLSLPWTFLMPMGFQVGVYFSE